MKHKWATEICHAAMNGMSSVEKRSLILPSFGGACWVRLTDFTIFDIFNDPEYEFRRYDAYRELKEAQSAGKQIQDGLNGLLWCKNSEVSELEARLEAAEIENAELKAKLRELEQQEPVAWMWPNKEGVFFAYPHDTTENLSENGYLPLYAAPKAVSEPNEIIRRHK